VTRDNFHLGIFLLKAFGNVAEEYGDFVFDVFLDKSVKDGASNVSAPSCSVMGED
jgi:hypothetical protein